MRQNEKVYVPTSALSYSTKPKPLCFPVVLSMGMLTSLISPKGMNAECSVASFTFSSRPPTYKVVFLLVPFPATSTARQLAIKLGDQGEG